MSGKQSRTSRLMRSDMPQNGQPWNNTRHLSSAELRMQKLPEAKVDHLQQCDNCRRLRRRFILHTKGPADVKS